MLEFNLKNPLEVYVKRDGGGSYEPHSDVQVSFKGQKGLKALKRLQDVIFKTFAQQAKGNTGEAKAEAKTDAVVTVEEVLDILEMTGETEAITTEVIGALKSFATIGGEKVTETMLDGIEPDDLDELVKEVLKHFLLPKITKLMNNMSR